MKVVVVILNWRNASDTIVCLESVLRSTMDSFTVFVCDNASEDGSIERFLEWSASRPDVASSVVLGRDSSADLVRTALEHRVVWIDSGANLGFAGGNNVALRVAIEHGSFEYFWLLNNDCVVDSGAMQALVERMTEDPTIGICGAKVRYLDGQKCVQAYGGARHNYWSGRALYLGHLRPAEAPHDPQLVENSMSYVCGASMFVRREFIETVGLLCEDYFLYFEEIDWALRGRSSFRLGYASKAEVFHKEGATIGSSSDTRRTSRLADFYLFRNRLRFTARFFPYALPSVWLVMLLQALRRGARGQTERMWLIVQILFGRRDY